MLGSVGEGEVEWAKDEGKVKRGKERKGGEGRRKKGWGRM